MVNRDFLKQVLSGQKRLMPLKDVRQIYVPKFEELAVEKMMPLMKEDAEFMSYFPDKMPKGRPFARDYFWNVLNTHNEPYVSHLVQHANSERYSAVSKDTQSAAIEVTDEWI